MLLFEAAAFANDKRGWRLALSEAHAEIASLRASLREAHAREASLRRRCELLEGRPVESIDRVLRGLLDTARQGGVIRRRAQPDVLSRGISDRKSAATTGRRRDGKRRR